MTAGPVSMLGLSQCDVRLQAQSTPDQGALPHSEDARGEGGQGSSGSEPSWRRRISELSSHLAGGFGMGFGSHSQARLRLWAVSYKKSRSLCPYKQESQLRSSLSPVCADS